MYVIQDEVCHIKNQCRKLQTIRQENALSTVLPSLFTITNPPYDVFILSTHLPFPEPSARVSVSMEYGCAVSNQACAHRALLR